MHDFSFISDVCCVCIRRVTCVCVTAQALSPNGEYIDWRMFLLGAAQPWPRPTQEELLVTRSKFQEMDQKQSGFVTREQYERVSLWFQGQSHPQTPADPSAPYPYDRLANLHIAFFDLFADHTREPPSLDYVRMVSRLESTCL